METQRNIHHLIRKLNQKAAEAGEDVVAHYIEIDSTWGDRCGIAISGTGDIERGVAYAENYYRRHLAKKRTLGTQYAYRDMGEEQVYINPGPNNMGRLYRRKYMSNTDAKVRQNTYTMRLISLVYYPCAD